MCFSVEVEKELKKLAKFFRAQVSDAHFEYLEALRLREKDTSWLKAQLNLAQKPRSSFFKGPDQDSRIFPGYFAPVIVHENAERTILPMRYRVRPAGSKEEIPTKFNVFNARLDSLENRQTWQPLFMRKHGLFPFVRFFEWVEDEGKKRLIAFSPGEEKIMWAPCLWDYWESKDGSLSFHSFALITDGPPPEIEARGHDRCPIFLSEDLIDEWLAPEGRTKSEMYRILKTQKKVTYGHHFAS